MIAHPRRSPRKIATNSLPAHDHDADYAVFLAGVRQSFLHTAGSGPIFTTDASGLFDVYLDALPADRQIHNCTACHRFIKEFGGLVCIAGDGATVPVMWDICPDFYRHAVSTLSKTIRRARVTGPYLSKASTWGIPHTGPWSHLAVESGAAGKYRERLLTASQAMAAKREDFRTVSAALADFTLPMLNEALRLLETESLRMSERFVSPVRWLIDLQIKRAALKGHARDNVLWLAIATAPDGYCHPRASVIGSLLEDIAAGMGFEEVRAAFNAKIAPLAYQRPQAPPTSGNIAAAEKIVEKMGLQPALERRYARLDDLETAWLPASTRPSDPAAGGVFGHLQAKGAVLAPGLIIPAITVTWAKFCRTLPTAERIELLVPRGAACFLALTAAVNAEAPPILKWDREGARNQVAWYVYPGGSSASQWRLVPDSWVKVTAVTPLPTLWGDMPSPHLGEGAVLVLDGCVDTKDVGNALFPSCLRDDLHQVRATIEAYSRSAKLFGREEASACGLDFRKGTRDINATLRVLSGGAWTTYLIDRWD